MGINVNEITTGLPNINIADFTGLSGGPNFLPVNPKQVHYQFEDALVQVVGRHQLKYGYRWVWRQPSPLTHTDTRSTLTLGRNFVNNPVNNTGGTGLATLLLGFVNSGSRGFLMEPYVLDVHEHGMFIQDDFKLRRQRDRQRRPALRDLHARRRAPGSPGQLRPGRQALHLRR